MTPEGEWRFLTVLLCGLIAIGLGLHPISDPDLGWHLAAGLWIVDHHQVPTVDPFAAGASRWVDYSWLFQLGIAALFRLGGFAALWIFQALTIFGFLLSVVWLSQRANSGESISYAKSSFVSLITLLIVTVLTAPFWQLRPQVLSFTLFAIFLGLTDSTQDFFKKLLLTILWANIHVFWVFAPILHLLKSKHREPFLIVQLGALVLAGLISPYGIQNLLVVFEYAFDHSIAYELITEFQPLSPEHGFVLWIFICVTALVLTRIIYSERRLVLILPWAMTLLLAFQQVKYIPLFALTSVPLLGPTVAEAFRGKIWSTQPTRILKPTVVVALLALTSVIFVTTERDILSEHVRALLRQSNEIAQIESQRASTDRFLVWNEFNDGGWLIYGLLSNPSTQGRARVSLDGRTLVAGAQRLADFQSALKNQKGWWEEVVSLRPRYVVVTEPKLEAKLCSADGLQGYEVSWRCIR